MNPLLRHLSGILLTTGALVSRPAAAENAPVRPAEGALRSAPLAGNAGAPGEPDELLSKVDPARDSADWAAEAFADRAAGMLKKLALASERAGRADVHACGKLAAAEFRSGPLRPAQLRTVFQDGSLRILRGTTDNSPVQSGGAGLAELLNNWTAAVPEGTEIHTKFKIVAVQLDVAAGTAGTTALVQSAAGTPAGIAQQSATWTCQWRLAPGDSEEPLLTGIVVADYEEVHPVRSEASNAPLFVDAAPLILGGTDVWKSFLIYGLDHWFKQVDVAFQIPQGYHGVALRDVDGDDREDVFLCQPAGIRKMLLRRQPDGTLKDISAAAGVDFLDNSRSALFVDLDNDGDADLALTLGYGVVLFANDGKGHFSYRAKADLASWPMSVVSADYDLDGDLDLYLCGYNPREAAAGGDVLANPLPYHDANNGAPNFLLRNEGNWKFTDATASTGLNVNNRRFTLAAMWEDCDNDGDQDLYVVNDFGRKNFYRNDLIMEGRRQPSAHFTDVAAAAGVEDIGAGMSASWADFDHDGWMDLYVANMFSSAGRRVAYQSRFQPAASPEDLTGYRRHARGNSLFRNHGDGTFRDVAEESGTVLGRWAWASLFADFNNDSREDIYVCNGFYSRPDPGDL